MEKMLEQRVSELEKGQKEIMKRQEAHEKTMGEQYKSIMHVANQARQESANTTIYVKDVDNKMDKLISFVMPNDEVGSIGIFKEQKALEKRVTELEVEKKIEKGQIVLIKTIVAFLGTAIGIVFAYFKSKL
jgi:uracil phosphoribosyltransferase